MRLKFVIFFTDQILTRTSVGVRVCAHMRLCAGVCVGVCIASAQLFGQVLLNAFSHQNR